MLCVKVSDLIGDGVNIFFLLINLFGCVIISLIGYFFLINIFRIGIENFGVFINIIIIYFFNIMINYGLYIILCFC